MKKVILSFLSIMLTMTAWSQSRLSYYELGVGVGTLNHKGEIATTTNTDALLAEMRPNFSVWGKKHFNDWFSIGLETSYGVTVAEDFNHTHQRRGLSVSTGIFQVNPFVEMNLLKFGKFHYERKFTVFVRGGAGFLAYNPTPSASNTYPDEFEVHPNAYKSINYFAGMGMRFRLNYNSILTVGIDVHNSGVDDMDGIIHIMEGLRGKNDSYGGVRIAFSRAFF